ncbi:MAG: hypothetical protein ACYTGQ_06925 [Planctomycetota bacterium]
MPTPFELTLQSTTVDGRHVYYEVDGDGAFRFGGGRDGVMRIANDVGVLSEQQMAAVWSLVQDGGLLSGANRGFVEPERVKYSMTVRAGKARHSFRNIDAGVPGVAPLDELLFGYQAQMRYGEVFKPIDDKIEKSGGVVEKKN